jgi:hypothetical protein
MTDQPEVNAQGRGDRIFQLAGHLSASLFPVLTTYFSDFRNNVKELNQTELFALAKQYAERLVIRGITPKKLVNGIERVKAESVELKWSPNPEEFARLCEPTAEQLGIPTLEQAKAEIIKARGIERGNNYTFSHDLCAELNRMIGFEMYQLNDQAWTKKLSVVYHSLFKQVVGGTLNKQAPAVAELEHKPAHYVDPGNAYYAEHKDPLMRRVAALRAAAKGRTE